MDRDIEQAGDTAAAAGQVLRQLSPGALGTCDWGDCDRATVAERWDIETKIWLPVCAIHQREVLSPPMAAAAGQVPTEAIRAARRAALRRFTADRIRNGTIYEDEVMEAALAAAAPLIAAAQQDTNMYEIAYWAVEKVLDEALGTEEEDGSGGGIAAEVYLLMEQRNQARADVARLTAERDAARKNAIEEAATVIEDTANNLVFQDNIAEAYDSHDNSAGAYLRGMKQAASLARAALAGDSPGGPR